MTFLSDPVGVPPPDLAEALLSPGRQRDIVARLDLLARWDWEHSLAPQTALRRSIAFRVLRGLE